MRRGHIPSHLYIDRDHVLKNFAKRLEDFKAETGLSWDNLAGCIGVDARQLQRWRKGTKPSGHGLYALILLASKFPGGVHTLFEVRVAPPVDPYQPSLIPELAQSRDSRKA